MKSKREHRVPLTDRAIEILQSLPAEEGNPYLFIGLQPGRPLSNAAMAKLLKDMEWKSTTPGKLATVHGMRSTFRDWAGETTNFPRELAEAALAHIGDLPPWRSALATSIISEWAGTHGTPTTARRTTDASV